jgi:hypothetical protein
MNSTPALFAFTDADGWHAGIGDPTVMGWVTVAAYLGTAAIAFYAARRAGAAGRRQGLFWLLLAALLLLLGVNKQLDLQTWFTVTARKLARAQGWYEQRRIVQLVFIAGIAAAAMIAFLLIWRLVAHQARDLWLPLLGLSVLLCFVVIRAASFHHLDQFLRFRVSGVKMNWLLELGGISIVAAGALARSRRPSTHSPKACAGERPRAG